jgi:two-component system response regulator NreC
MSAKIRVLLCDDHALFRGGIRALLGEEPSIEVVGEATNGREAIEAFTRLHPDVVLMDIEMPDLSGFETARRIRVLEPQARVLMVTMHADEDLVTRSLEAGASGYLLKDAPVPQLVYAIETVHKGGRYMSPGALGGFIELYEKGAERAETGYDRLTPREKEVLKLLADGLTVKAIASVLGLSVKTVDVHKYNLMQKLDIHDRSQLVKYALQKKLIRLPGVQGPLSFKGDKRRA